jgi:hypothetical protein
MRTQTLADAPLIDAEILFRQPGPALARLSAKPAAIGSLATVKTIGIVRVACCIGDTVEAPCAKMNEPKAFFDNP